MNINLNFSIPKTLEEARAIQEKLRTEVIPIDQLGVVQYIAGVDVGFEDNYTITKAAVVILTFPELKVVESQTARISTTFPYIPGFLSFREIPALLKVLEKINIVPDIILCDGQGISHPRRLGIASHLGVLIGLPTIGVAKSLFVGKHSELALEKDSWQPLIDQGETIGVVLRSRTNVRPLYLSIGHRISLPTTLDYVRRCLTKYRLPEPIRLADKLASTKR